MELYTYTVPMSSLCCTVIMSNVTVSRKWVEGISLSLQLPVDLYKFQNRKLKKKKTEERDNIGGRKLKINTYTSLRFSAM